MQNANVQTAFPLFTSQMYANLGTHWASSIPAFLALACVPFPFLFYKYGATIRVKCKYAAQSEKFMRQMQGQTLGGDDQEDEKAERLSETGTSAATDTEMEKLEDSGSPNDTARQDSRQGRRRSRREEREEEEERRESIVESLPGDDAGPIFAPITATKSRTGRQDTEYNSSPFDLDRVNTRESFKRSNSMSRTRSRATSMSSSKSRR